MASTTLWINGRFLSRKITGVERVAHEVLKAWATQVLAPDGSITLAGHRFIFKIALEPPANAAQNTRLTPEIPPYIPPYLLAWEIQQVGQQRRGHGWEQWDLARFSPADWLLNLCNTAPLLRQRQMVFLHDAQVFAIPGNFDWKFRLWYRCLFHAVGRRSRLLCTNSQFSQGEIARYVGLDAARLHVAHLGCDHMQGLQVAAGALPAALAAQIGGRPYVLAVSSASPNKNFAAVLQALDILQRQAQAAGRAAPLGVIVGQRYAQVFKPSAHAAAAVDNTPDTPARVLELGYVSDAELAALYRHALCLVYPSFYEGFGLPPLEAMACGCPVVVSNTSSLPEVCGDAALYCDPSAPATIVQAIEHLMDLHASGALEPLRARSRAHASGFSWERTSRQLLGALLQAVQAERAQ